MAARDPIPEFDLYEELEVSPKASQPTIEAAYRSLLKRHHPDVSGGDEQTLERSKRINVAHDWLADPTRRAEYDRARGGGTGGPQASGQTGATPSGAQTGAAPSGPPTGAGRSGARTGSPPHGSGPGGDGSPYGPNAATFAAFMDDLRGITRDRARRIADRAAHAASADAAPGTYRAAALAVAAASPGRQEACVIVRRSVRAVLAERLGDSPYLGPVSGVAEDLACAIVIRDLIPKGDYATIRAVWTGSKPGHGRGGTANARSAGDPGAGRGGGAWTKDTPPRPPLLDSPAALLADIAVVDLARAQRVTDAYRKAGPSGRDGARIRAIGAAAARRDAWRSARQEAERAARARVPHLGGRVSADVFAWAAADAAGALALRDLITPEDFSLLFAPWALGLAPIRKPLKVPIWAWGAIGIATFLLLGLVVAFLMPGTGSGAEGPEADLRPRFAAVVDDFSTAFDGAVARNGTGTEWTTDQWRTFAVEAAVASQRLAGALGGIPFPAALADEASQVESDVSAFAAALGSVARAPDEASVTSASAAATEAQRTASASLQQLGDALTARYGSQPAASAP